MENKVEFKSWFLEINEESVYYIISYLLSNRLVIPGDMNFILNNHSYIDDGNYFYEINDEDNKYSKILNNREYLGEFPIITIEEFCYLKNIPYVKKIKDYSYLLLLLNKYNI